MHHPLRTITQFFLWSTLLGMGAVIVFLITMIPDIPNPTSISDRPVAESTKIYDRTGTVLLYEIHGEEKRTVIPFSRIPDSVKKATLAAEDSGFYSHGGIDIKGIVRALYIDIKDRDASQGGSTITQQLVKKTLVGDEKTIDRKIKEAILAILVESRYTKDQIFELYLNQIPYGSNAYGIEAAAETFFGTSADHLDLAQSAALAALPRAPSRYSPYGAHKDELLKLKDAILDRMQSLGFISAEDRDRAKKETLAFAPPKQNMLAPHFVMYVRDYLNQKYGESTVENGGLKIITTLDWNLQQKAESIVKESVTSRESLLGAYNASLVALDPKTGQILAMVGSRDYWADPEPAGCAPGLDCLFDPHVNVATRLRQPGSAFKPFAYVTAFAKGYTPDTALFDVPTEFNPLCTNQGIPQTQTLPASECYHPVNYDGTFRGPVTMRQALQQSLNVPSVKTLYLAGIDATIHTAQSVGITSLGDRSRFGLSLVLGGGEVQLLELVNAYGAFAEDGTYNPATAILRVEDSKGGALEHYTPSPVVALDQEAVRKLNSVLTDNEARVPVFIRDNSLYFPDRSVAAKTGTTQDNRDAWTIGYTPSLAAGVWVGNSNNAPMKENTAGVLAAAPIWKKFMQEALATSTPEVFTPPSDESPPSKPILRGLWQGGTVMTIDTVTKQLATDLTPKGFRKDVAVGEPHSILYWLQKDDPAGAPPADPSNDPQFHNWEEAVQTWLRSHGYQPSTAAIAPGTDTIHTEQHKPVITIERSTLSKSDPALPLSITSTFPLQEIDALFDVETVSVKHVSGSDFLLMLPEQPDIGIHTIKISAFDVYGNRQTIEKNITIRE